MIDRAPIPVRLASEQDGSGVGKSGLVEGRIPGWILEAKRGSAHYQDPAPQAHNGARAGAPDKIKI